MIGLALNLGHIRGRVQGVRWAKKSWERLLNFRVMWLVIYFDIIHMESNTQNTLILFTSNLIKMGYNLTTYAAHWMLLIVIYCKTTDFSDTVGYWNLVIVLLTCYTIFSASDKSNFLVYIGMPSLEDTSSGI